MCFSSVYSLDKAWWWVTGSWQSWAPFPCTSTSPFCWAVDSHWTGQVSRVLGSRSQWFTSFFGHNSWFLTTSDKLLKLKCCFNFLKIFITIKLYWILSCPVFDSHQPLTPKQDLCSSAVLWILTHPDCHSGTGITDRETPCPAHFLWLV